MLCATTEFVSLLPGCGNTQHPVCMRATYLSALSLLSSTFFITIVFIIQSFYSNVKVVAAHYIMKLQVWDGKTGCEVLWMLEGFNQVSLRSKTTETSLCS